MPSYPFRHSICNEMYGRRPFAESCRAIRAAGYSGIEVAPFTLDQDPASIPPARRQEYASIIRGEGLEFAGLHWLLVTPVGLHVSTADRAVREKSWDYFRRLVDLAAGLGPGGVMVFGSPEQRSTTGGMHPAQARRHLTECFARAAAHAAERGVTLVLEAVPEPHTDVVTTLEEAAALVNEINSPAVRTMFDVHNAIHETEPHPALIDRYFDLIAHVHVNEPDGRHPACGGYDFLPLFRTLARRNYDGWISLEAFDFTPGADRIAAESLRYLMSQIELI